MAVKNGCPVANRLNGHESVHNTINSIGSNGDCGEVEKQASTGCTFTQSAFALSKMNENTAREIPKGGMLYGDYLHVSELPFWWRRCWC